MATRKINDENAESIGKAIMEKALQLVAQSDQKQYLKCFPDLRVYKAQEIFEDAAESLILLGENPTVEYLDQLIKPDCNVLLWLIESQYAHKALMLRLELSESTDKIKLAHLSFKQLYENESTNAELIPTGGHLNHENSESLGTPIVENILKSLLTSEFELYCQTLPDVPRNNVDQVKEISDEAVGVLKPMGNIIFIKCLAHARTANLHTLFWKVRYEKEDEDLLIDLILTDDKDKVQLEGFAFDR